MNIVIRQVLERQIGAGQALSNQLVDATTDLATAIATAPGTFAGAVREGETLATAFSRTGTAVQDVAVDTGQRIRSAVSGYVGHQATLPIAVINGAAEVAGSVAQAQGTVTGSAMDTMFALATAAAKGGDVREALALNLCGVSATATAARGDVGESFRRARQDLRDAVGDGELAS